MGSHRNLCVRGRIADDGTLFFSETEFRRYRRRHKKHVRADIAKRIQELSSMKIQLVRFCLMFGLLMSSASPVFATITNFGSLPPPASLNYGNSFASPVGQFFDDTLFSIPASEIGVFASTVEAVSLLGISNYQALIYKGTASDIPSEFTEVSVLNSTFLSTGDHILKFKGTVTGSSDDADSGMHATPTPVPEPQAYALMLAGLGLLVFVAGGKKQPVAT
jgi:hypothetical protein